MKARAAKVAAGLCVGETFDAARFGRDVMADAMPMLLAVTQALNYAYFKMLGSREDLPGGLGFSYGPEAVAVATYDVAPSVLPDYYDRIFTFRHDQNGCWISMKSFTTIQKGTEVEFQATVSPNGTFVVTTRDRHGDIASQSQTNNPQEIVDLCTEWVNRIVPLAAQRRVVATYVTRIADGMESDRSARPVWSNRYRAV